MQIAGLLARRIVCDAKVGDTLPIGDTYGLIRFGSRVDTYFPAGTTLLVERGQRDDRCRDRHRSTAVIADAKQQRQGSTHSRRSGSCRA